jgi:AcrR family transcriptional regulator
LINTIEKAVHQRLSPSLKEGPHGHRHRPRSATAHHHLEIDPALRQQGYDGVTYQKIADSCGIARTTLYKYFHSKRPDLQLCHLGSGAILIDRFAEILDPQASVVTRLDRLLHAVLQLLFEQRVILTVILDYVLAAQRTGQDLAHTIASHTPSDCAASSTVSSEGVRKGELRTSARGAGDRTDLRPSGGRRSASDRQSERPTIRSFPPSLHQSIENFKPSATALSRPI